MGIPLYHGTGGTVHGNPLSHLGPQYTTATLPCRTGGNDHGNPMYHPDPTVRPILLYHVGQVGRPMEYHPYPQCCPRSYCLSYPTVPCRIGGMSNGIPSVPQCYPRSHCPSYPTVPCRIGVTSVDQDPSPSYILMYSTAFESGYQYGTTYRLIKYCYE